MKRIIFFALICAAALLSSCKKNEKDISNELVAILGSSTNDYWQNMSNGIAYESGLSNITRLDIWYTNGDNDAKSQLNALESCSNYSELKGIIIAPINKEVEEAAYDTGRLIDVPVVVIDSPVTEGTPLAAKCRSQIYTDNQMAVDTLYALAKENQNRYILFVGKNNSNSSISRRNYAKKLVEEDGLEYREIVTDCEAGDVAALTASALNEHPEISGIICFNGSLITEEFLDAAKGKDIYTFDYTDLIANAIYNGKIRWAARQYTYEMGVASVDAVFNGLILNPYVFSFELIDKTSQTN